jgi:hypothetical protein
MYGMGYVYYCVKTGQKLTQQSVMVTNTCQYNHSNRGLYGYCAATVGLLISDDPVSSRNRQISILAPSIGTNRLHCSGFYHYSRSVFLNHMVVFLRPLRYLTFCDNDLGGGGERHHSLLASRIKTKALSL